MKYISTLLQREVQDLSRIEGLSEMPRLLSLLASRSASLLNFSALSRSLGFSNMTLKRYLSLLQAVFVVHLVPAWTANIGKRLIKSPKVFLNDTGLLGFLCGLTAESLQQRPEMAGILLENFVMQELFKQNCWSDTAPNIFYYRTAGGKEVDFVLEAQDGRVVGIEVKGSSRVQAPDLLLTNSERTVVGVFMLVIVGSVLIFQLLWSGLTYIQDEGR